MKTADSLNELIEMIMNIDHPEFRCVDNGIGNYEYWGYKGVHHDYDWEVEGNGLEVKVNFIIDVEDLLENVDEAVFEAQDALYKNLNKYRDEDFDYGDIVILDYEFENNILTFEWNRN
jgi:hypothetical protein